ncbi:DJ-1/PfpI family protein [Acholeplasma hippikon]|uniref:DJ-1/PfpI family protein n=1 Tax=Acholeplasma hippikon TaxID=264636 RepID=A0A449BLB6_9MOLU|nr:DJ-1/PfpI family protein [Acholeplasma hippikon]VEU83223.1 DJ-1/PfpI family protein [Acholeplasma hippikon]
MKGLFIFSDGMEDNEALSTRALLVRAGFEIDSATINHNLIVETSYKQKVICDLHMDEVDFKNYDFLLIPGGPYVNHIIDDEKVIKNAILAFNEAEKVIGAICAAPRFLGRLGLLEGKEFTAYPGSEKEVKNSLYFVDKKSIICGNIVTARSAGTVIDFVYNLIVRLKNEAAANELLDRILYR